MIFVLINCLTFLFSYEKKRLAVVWCFCDEKGLGLSDGDKARFVYCDYQNVHKTKEGVCGGRDAGISMLFYNRVMIVLLSIGSYALLCKLSK